MAEEEFSDTFRSGSFPEGTMLGHYRLEWFVGRNSTGEMYSAVDVENNKSCSLTVVFPSVSKHAPEIAGQLLRNAQEACFFSHPNIIRVLEAFSLPGCSCVVTEYFSGENIEQLLLRGRISETQMLSILSQLASLLAAAGNVPGLIPDFTPDTLYIDPQGRVKVFYPGFKRYLHLLPGNVLVRERELLRLAAFTAPEVLRGTAQTGIPSAMYSLGMLMSCLLCGRTPFEGENPCQTMAAILGAEKCDISSAAPHISPRSAAIIASLTAQDPGVRPASGSALLKMIGKKSSFNAPSLKYLLIGGAVAAALLIGGGGIFFCKEFFQKDEVLESVLGSEEIVSQKEEQLQRNKQLPRQLPSAPKPDTVTVSQEQKLVPPAKSPGKNPPREERKKPLASAAPETEHVRYIRQRIDYCRQRVRILQEEISSGGNSHMSTESLTRRLEFRKKQCSDLARYAESLASSPAARTPVSEEVNRQLRSEVANWFSRFRNLSQLATFRYDLRRGKPSSFPVEKLKAPGVDFLMQFPIPGNMRNGSNKSKTVSLGNMLLEEYLVSQAEGANILYSHQASLPGIEQDLLLRISRNHMISPDVLRYIAAEFARTKKPLQFESLLRFQFNYRFSFLLELILLFSESVPADALYWAAADEKTPLSTIRLLLDGEVPLEYRDKEGRTPLMQAVIHGNRELADLLRRSGADEQCRDKHGKCAGDYQVQGQLLKGIRTKNIREVAAAVANGADVNFIWIRGTTPLLEACARGDKAIVALLLRKGANPDLACRGRTPLQSCFRADKSSMEIFKLLLNTGVGFRADNFMNFVCQGRPTRKTAPAFAQMLLESNKCKVTPAQLFSVCRLRNIDLFRVLVEKGPMLNKRPYRGLMAEALRNNMPPDVIKLLLQRKAPLPSGHELSYLLKNSSSEVKALFRREPEKPKSQYTGGRGDLMSNPALADRVAQIVKKDRSSELEPMLKTRRITPDSIADEMTLLQLAARYDSSSVITLLLSYKADPFKITYKNRKPAILYAVESGNYAALNLLAQCVPPHEEIHLQCVAAIWKTKTAETFLKLYLQKNEKALTGMKECLLTFALRENAPEPIIRQLAGFYRVLSADKHRSVVHQAVAGGYRREIIDLLLRSGAVTSGKASVLIRDKETGKSSRETLTVFEAAEKVEAGKDIVQLLIKKHRR